MDQPHTLSPIHRLSDDILVLIFLHFPARPFSWYKTATRTRAPKSVSTWLHITHVCRRWRTVSVGCSPIWIHVNFSPPSWAPVFLERASQAPLHVEANWKREGSRHYIDDAVALALGHLHHTRSLAVNNPPGRFVDRMIAAFRQQQVEILESIKLYNFDDASSLPGASISTIQLPDKLFAGPVPRLQALKICGRFTFHWRSQLFASSLTHIDLFITEESSPSAMDELLEMLRMCPLLEHLLLQNCLPSDSPPTILALLPENYSTVDMPNLKSIMLGDITFRVANLLRRLQIPGDCRIDISNTHLLNSLSETAVTEALAAEVGFVLASRPVIQDPALHIVQFAPYTITWSLTSLQLPQPTAPSFSDKFNGAPEHIFDLSVTSQPQPAGFNELEHTSAVLAGIFARTMPLYPFSSLRSMSVCATLPGMVSHNTWLVVLRDLKLLESLRIQAHCCYTFAPPFAFLALERQTLPCLKKLQVVNAHLSYPLGSQGLAIELQNALDRRRELGGMTFCIELMQCRVSPAELHNLQEASGHPVEVSGDPETFGVGESYDEGTGVDAAA